MPGHTNVSAKFEMRVPLHELADWRRRAAAKQISVAELIKRNMRRGDDHSTTISQQAVNTLADAVSKHVLQAPELSGRDVVAVAVALPLKRDHVTPRFKPSMKIG